MTQEMLNRLTQSIDVREFYSHYFKEWSKNTRGLVSCPFHKDTNASLKINDDGSFKCFGCGKSGGGVVKFYQYIKGLSTFREAMDELWSNYIERPIPKDVLKKQIAQLKVAEEFKARLKKERGWDFDRLAQFELGLTKDGNRLSIPIYDKYGMCINVVYLNVLRTPGYKHTLPFESGRRMNQLWPVGILSKPDQNVVLCEGYRDALTLLSQGMAAFTVGSSSYQMRQSDIDLLAGREVVILYDVDNPGRKGAKKMADRLLLKGSPSGVKVVDIPIADTEHHSDVSDWLVAEHNTMDDLGALISGTPHYKLFVPKNIDTKDLLGGADKSLSLLSSSPPLFVPLREVRSSEHFHKIYETEAVVVGKSTSTYYVPKTYECVCRKPKPSCIDKLCPFVGAENHTLTVSLEPEDQVITRFLEASDRDMLMALKDMLGVALGCPISATVSSAFGVTKMLLAPPLDEYKPTDNSEAIQILGYFFGTQVQTNTPYLFKAYSSRHPKDNSMIAIILEAQSTATTLDAFEMDAQKKESLSKFKIQNEGNIYEQLIEYYHHCARSITGIKDRPLAHMAADLVWHSPVSFQFAGTFLRKGSLDVLLFGDSRTGKNYIADGFREYYQHGEIISGENVTKMNLIGGIKAANKFRGLSWGRFVVRHKSTVIVDEMSSINLDDIGALSRIRSEGIANVDKDGLHQNANAICGILWLSNPRDNRTMWEHQYGVEALQGLMRKAEDIARFDYVMAMAMGEVPSQTINQANGELEPHRFSKEECHDLILWIKSRARDQIDFTPQAVAYIMRESLKLADDYTHEIQLVQAENIRFKVAKVAASIAGKIFSCDSSGNVLVVTEKIAEAAVRFLRDIYDTPALGYKSYSELVKRFLKVDREKVRKCFKHIIVESDTSYKTVCSVFANLRNFNLDDLQSSLGICAESARHLRNDLARFHCIQRAHQYYIKSRGFNDFLRDEMVNGECNTK